MYRIVIELYSYIEIDSIIEMFTRRSRWMNGMEWGGGIVLKVIEFIRCQPEQCLPRPLFNTFHGLFPWEKTGDRLKLDGFLYLYKIGKVSPIYNCCCNRY